MWRVNETERETWSVNKEWYYTRGVLYKPEESRVQGKKGRKGKR
jgi:hypothetical protein